MTYAICTVAAAPLRKEPSHRSEMTSQLLFGDTMELLEERDEWFHVRCLYDNYEGWTTHHLIAPIEATTATTLSPFVTTGLVNKINQKDVVFQIPMGCTLTGYDEATHQLWDDSYMYTDACRNVKDPFTNELFQNLIRPWLHAPYLWGGKTFMGVDCSGFVQTIFKIQGVPLLRDAYQQATQGSPVKDSATAQEGDIAFFHNEAGRITHVGIVLKNNQIIHASGTVRIDRFTNEGIFTATGKQTHHLHSIRRMVDFPVK